MSEIGDLIDHLERLAASQDRSFEVLEEIADGLERLREWIAPRQRPKLTLIRGEATCD
jgi:ABC-type transporter Mla subunit MlaD